MSSKLKPTLIVLALFATLLAACGAPGNATAPAAANTTPISPNTPVSFAKDVTPILQNYCLKCHGGEQTQKGLSVASYAALMAGSQNGPVVVPGDPSTSKLITLIQQGKMPKRGPKPTANELQILINWVTQGAQNN